MDLKLTAAPVSAIAPGKVNISFKVGSLRGDKSRGVATLYQAVSVYDTVIAYPSESFELAHSATVGFGEVPCAKDNLAMRAARMLAEYGEVQTGVRLELIKDIPRGAGMSSGSADAAAALVACNELWGLRFSKETLKGLAFDLGPDVSFALDGGTAVGTGHGDEFSQALSTGIYHWVIVPVGPRLKEATVLAELDRHRQRNRDIIGDGDLVPRVDLETLLAIRSGSPARLAEAISNDVQAASFKLEPALAEFCEYGEQGGALVGVMLAMGPAMAFLAASENDAADLFEWLESAGHHGFIAHGPVGGARLTASRATM